MKDIACLFHVLSNPTRLQVYTLILKEACEDVLAGKNEIGGNCVGEIAKALHLNQPTVSNHIKELINVNLVTSRKVGKHTYLFGVKTTAKKLAAFSDFIAKEIQKTPHMS